MSDQAIKVTMKLTGDQFAAMQQALETLARIGMGQFQAVSDVFPDSGWDERSQAEQALKPILTPALDPGGHYYSIASREVPSHCQIAWELYQSLRKENSWRLAGNPERRDWSTMMSVCYDDPMPISGVPLPTVTVEGVS